MMWTPNDQKKIDERLRSLLAQGLTIDEAVLHLHQIEGIGLLILLPSIVTVAEVEKSEAMRLLVRSTLR
jgi:hypothetical protein